MTISDTAIMTSAFYGTFSFVIRKGLIYTIYLGMVLGLLM